MAARGKNRVAAVLTYAAVLTFLVCACMPDAFSRQASNLSPAAAQPLCAISGRIVSGPAGVPGAAVTLLFEDGQRRRVARTDASGQYNFGSLPAGHYFLYAFDPGYFPEWFNMVPRPDSRKPVYRLGAPHMFEQGVVVDQKKPLATADFSLQRAPQVQQMPDSALARVYSRTQQAQLVFSSARFSPDGHFVAFATGDIFSGNPEQVWLYDLITGSVSALTPIPTAKSQPMIVSLHWTGNTLTAIGIWDGGRRLLRCVAQAGSAPQLTYRPAPFPSPQSEDLFTTAGRYVLTASVLHGGSVSWSAQRKGTAHSKVIAGALLNAPIVDPALPFFFYVPVSYPTTFVDNTVATLALETGRKRVQRLPAVENLKLLAAIRQGDGFLLAYSVNAPCTPAADATGQDPFALNGMFGTSPVVHYPPHLCFVHLAGPVPLELKVAGPSRGRLAAEPQVP